MPITQQQSRFVVWSKDRRAAELPAALQTITVRYLSAEPHRDSRLSPLEEATKPNEMKVIRDLKELAENKTGMHPLQISGF